MSHKNKYYKWLNNCINIINENNIKEKRRRLAVFLTICSYLEKKKKRSYAEKRFWVGPLFRLRDEHGFYNAILPTISQQISTFRNYFRMNSSQFEELLCKVAPLISKETLCREPIFASERLCTTLR